jgi:hypothetical protein
MLEDFYHTGKIQRLRPGLEPRTGVPEASMLTTRPLKPSHVIGGERTIIWSFDLHPSEYKTSQASRSVPSPYRRVTNNLRLCSHYDKTRNCDLL